MMNTEPVMTSSPLEATVHTNNQGVDAIIQSLKNRTATVAVLGLGYVGLPLAMTMNQSGVKVLGIDVNPDRIHQINSGQSPINDVADETVLTNIQNKLFKATADLSELKNAQVVVLCVPTPLNKNREPDLTFIEEATEAIAQHIQPGQIICLESTTYPGTTEDVMLPILAKAGLQVGEDFYLAYSPERVDPGNEKFNTYNTPKVVGGITDDCKRLATVFYESFIETVYPVSSAKAAEMVKIFENTFRAINIGLVNEMMLLCDRMGINIWEVLEAASTKPFGLMSFWPGPGVGGHCIPIDPFYLSWKAREFDFQTRFIELAGEINANMPRFVREKLIRLLGSQGKPLNGAKVLIVGMGYKPGVGDWRESPALALFEVLEADYAKVSFIDPFVEKIQLATGQWVKASPLSAETLQQCDCAILITPHKQFNLAEIAETVPLLLDTRNACKNLPPKLQEKVILL